MKKKIIDKLENKESLSEQDDNIIGVLNKYSNTDYDWLRNFYNQDILVIDPMDYYKIAEELFTPSEPKPTNKLIALIKNDAFAITFQTLRQYRNALLEAIEEPNNRQQNTISANNLKDTELEKNGYSFETGV